MLYEVITPANVEPRVKQAVLEAIELLDSGRQRVAEPTDSGWIEGALWSAEHVSQEILQQ